MKEFFVCTNCECVIWKNDKERHWKMCFDLETQQKKARFMYRGCGTDRDEKHVVLNSIF